jgi:5-methylcytosine-specific restriction endonuclease McrA
MSAGKFIECGKKKVISVLDPSEILNFIGSPNHIIIVDDTPYVVSLASRSLRFQKQKNNRKCVVCGIRGNKFLLLYSRDQKLYYVGFYHVPEAANDFARSVIKMTVDHILPLSKGGCDAYINYQTMCEPCNSKKGNSYEIFSGEL